MKLSTRNLHSLGMSKTRKKNFDFAKKKFDFTIIVVVLILVILQSILKFEKFVKILRKSRENEGSTLKSERSELSAAGLA